MSKQNSESANKGFGTTNRLGGSTAKHTHNDKPAKVAPEGNAAPGKHKRGKQGH